MQTHGTTKTSMFLKALYPLSIFEKGGMKRKKKGGEQCYK